MSKRIWTYEKVQAEAKKYSTQKDFRFGTSSKAYEAAKRNGWLASVCSHMKMKTYWNGEKIKNISLKYNDLSKFRKEQKGAYIYACRNGIVDEITSHMTRKIKQSGHWTKENCASEAAKYLFRTQFMRKSGSAYNVALANGWLDEICSHMSSEADGYHHCVYVIFNDRLMKAYIGITRQLLKKRMAAHFKVNSTTTANAITRIADTQHKSLTDYVLIADEVREHELAWIKKFENEGYHVLNDLKQVGRMGTDRRIHTDEVIFLEAKKYKTRSEFKRLSPRIYDAAVSQRLLSKACAHMRSIKPKNTWTKKACLEFARGCETKQEFRKNNGAYHTALKHGWLNDVYDGLKSTKERFWLRGKTEAWLMADHIYEAWIEAGNCGSFQLARITGIRSDKMLKRFRQGWVPSEDSDWLQWAKGANRSQIL